MTIIKNKLIYNLIYRGLCESLQTKDISSNVAVGVYDAKKIPDSLKTQIKKNADENTLNDTDSIILVKLLVDPDSSDDPKRITADKLHDILSRTLYMDKSDVEIIEVELDAGKFLVAKIKFADNPDEKPADSDNNTQDNPATDNVNEDQETDNLMSKITGDYEPAGEGNETRFLMPVFDPESFKWKIYSIYTNEDGKITSTSEYMEREFETIEDAVAEIRDIHADKQLDANEA